MRVSVKGAEVLLEGDGLEFLKITTGIVGLIGSKVRTLKGGIAFPASCLPSVNHLLPPDPADHERAKIVARFAGHASARLNSLALVEGGRPEGLSAEWAEILDPPQAVAVSAMIVPGLLGLCLFDEQGTGKTVMTIAAFDLLRARGDVKALIVVCPKNMMSEWPKEIERFCGGIYKVLVADGGRQAKYRTALSPFDVLVTNYEGVEGMLNALIGSAVDKPFVLAVDESYFVKNQEALRSKTIGKLRQAASKCFVLCGTPAPNSPYDLVHQFDLADQGFTFGAFKPSADGSSDREAIEALADTRGTYVRRLKSDVLKDVPEKCFHVVRIPLSGRQAVLYERARAELELELRGLDNTKFRKRMATYFQKRAALLQICCAPSAVDPLIAETPVKYPVLDQLLERLFTQQRKAVVWSFYRRSLDELTHRYASSRPLRIDGSVGARERGAAVTQFQEDPTRMLFLGNPAAAGAGITLHASHDAIYMSYSNQAAHYLQSLDRIHRRGQVAHEVDYYLLVCEGTIEETEVLRLRGKELQQHSLLGDHIPWPSSLDEALAELAHVGV